MRRDMPIALVVALAACGGSSSSAPQDASFDRTPCEAAYQASLDRTCTVAADCVLVDHDDCCGTVKTGVRAASAQDAVAAEATYAACFSCGARGCAHADQAEDGSTPGSGEAIVAACVAQHCTSIVQ